MPQANGFLSPGLPHGLAEVLICLVGSHGLFAACAAHPLGRRQFLDRHRRKFLDRHMWMTVPVQVARRMTVPVQVARRPGIHSMNVTLPVLMSYMAPTNPISPLSIISRSTTLRSRSIRRIRAERRRRAIAWSDRFVLFVTTRATVQGRAGLGLRRDAPAFSGERARFTRLTDEGSDRLRRMATSICPQRPGCSSLRRSRS